LPVTGPHEDSPNGVTTIYDEGWTGDKSESRDARNAAASAHSSGRALLVARQNCDGSSRLSQAQRNAAANAAVTAGGHRDVPAQVKEVC
jgi:hypothetical protein